MDKQKQKKILISATAGALALAMAGGIWFGVSRKRGGPVPVYNFMDVGMTEYWGDAQESYGPVSTDNIQTVFLSKTQEITDILVKEGDTVKKGDLLMTFDTTLSTLDLERKRLEVEKLKLQLEDEKKRLREINAMKPMQPPPEMPEIEPVEPELGPELPGNPGYSLQPARGDSGYREHDGSSRENAMICWVRDDKFLTRELLLSIFSRSIELQMPDPQDLLESSRASAFLTDMLEEAPELPELPDLPPDGEQELPPPIPDGNGGDQQPQLPDPDMGISPLPPEEPETPPTEEIPELPPEEPTLPEQPEPSEPLPGENQPGGDIPEGILPDVSGKRVYAIIKITEGNTKFGPPAIWMGLEIQSNGAYRFFNAAGIPDFTLLDMLEDPEEPVFPDFDMGSGMTAGQIAKLREEQKKKIKEAEFKIKMADADYKIKKRELDDGNVHAEFDGVVVSLLPEDEARSRQKPLMKVSGGGGFFVEGSISELELDNVTIGQEVTVNDWNSGETYTGKIVSIGDFPVAKNGYNGMNNPNASQYPFKAFVDGSANLQAGSYVNIQYSAGGASNGVYLQNPFLRTEKGSSYVYVQGENGRLEKRYVKTGKSLWGNYTEIRAGLTAEDLVAFPYGKNVRPGAKTVPGSMEDLYS